METLQDFFIDGFGGLAKRAASYVETWEAVVADLPYSPVGYTHESLDYQYAYMSAFVDDLIDLSVILYQNGKAIGVWPVSLRKKDSVYEFATNQGPVMPPVYVKDLSERIIKKYDSLCLEAMQRLYISVEGKYKVKNTWQTSVSFLSCELLSQNILWEEKCMLLGAVPRVVHDLYVDLSWPLEKIHANMRKSYRSLINEGERLWQVEVHDCVDDRLFEEFRNLHIDVAGRVTRPKETWDLQLKAVNKGEDFLVTLRDSGQRMCGGGLFEASKTEGSYAVGAYDRNLFNKPVSHVVQWTAIKHLKQLGKRWHYVGQRFYESDIPVPSTKELQIAYFKEGFATDTALRLLLTVDLKSW